MDFDEFDNIEDDIEYAEERRRGRQQPSVSPSGCSVALIVVSLMALLSVIL